MDEKVSKMKIHKLYVLPLQQGKGVGRLMLNHLESIAIQAGVKVLSLNVNRKNKALDFLQKYGIQHSQRRRYRNREWVSNGGL